MAEDKNTSQINMRIPGMKGGPRNRGAVVESLSTVKKHLCALCSILLKKYL